MAGTAGIMREWMPFSIRGRTYWVSNAYDSGVKNKGVIGAWTRFQGSERMDHAGIDKAAITLFQTISTIAGVHLDTSREKDKDFQFRMPVRRDETANILVNIPVVDGNWEKWSSGWRNFFSGFINGNVVFRVKHKNFILVAFFIVYAVFLKAAIPISRYNYID